ncbi:MAG: glycosyltransferase [Rhodopila sp.]|jgi:ceramide glucosyltransferase
MTGLGEVAPGLVTIGLVSIGLVSIGLASLCFTSACLAGIGLAQALVAARLVASFTRRRPAAPSVRPPVTLLKPLHGDEPLLEAALKTLCRQDYPDFQIVFGVQDATDPAAAVVNRLQAGHPDLDIALVVDPSLHGRNRKVGNLINMMAAARHDILVIADADIHVRADYLDRLVAALLQPGVGVVTTLYAGLPVIRLPLASQPAPGRRTRRAEAAKSWVTDPSRAVTRRFMDLNLPARLGATQITHGFLPGALLARALGRQDCLGATMCLRRQDLERIGGFPALVDHLADDNVLGRRIVSLGLRVALADTVTLTTVPEASLSALFRHELRWARTIRALEPAGFAASALQYPLAWALLTILLAGGSSWSDGFFLIAWVLRIIAANGVDRALAPVWAECPPAGHSGNSATALAFSCPVWLLPLRDILSVAVMLASYGGRQVDWRGHGLHADTPPPSTHRPATPAVTVSPFQGTNAR